jgi:RND family efflux transporter MFP subunit
MKETFVMILLLALLLGGCRDKAEQAAAPVQRPLVSGVELFRVALTQVDDYYETSATVKAKSASVVAARMPGTVTNLAVGEGERVRAGQVLLSLDDRDVRQKIGAAEAALAEAQKAAAAAEKQQELARVTCERFRNLFAGKALTRQELDEAETRLQVAELEHERGLAMVDRARAGLAEAKVYQEFTRVSSPVAGLVSSKRVDTGTMVMPGVPLFTIEDDSSFRLEMQVNETQVSRLAAGLEVAVDIPAMGLSLTGTVSDVVAAVDPGARSFLVKIALPATSGLRSGLYARVRIPVGQRSAIVLPAASIVDKGQLSGVYAVNDDNIVSYRLVRLGKRYGEGREILSGLREGERVIVAGVEHAADGGLLQGDRGQ